MSVIDLIGVVLVFAGTGIVGLLVTRIVAIPYSLALVLLDFLLSYSLSIFHWYSGIRASNFLFTITELSKKTAK